MKALLLILLCIPSISQASFEYWNKQDQRLYQSFITFQAIDLIQAFNMIECQERDPNCRYWERNPLIGSHPKKAEVVIFKLVTNFMIYNMLDKRMKNNKRRGTLIILNVVSIVPVISNEHVGLGFYIPILPYNQFSR